MSTLRDAMSHAALGWVKPELDETLRQVRNEVEYFVEEPSDTGRMRFCAGHLHQVQGTLRMVELYAPAMVAEELEQLANAIGTGDVLDRDEACATLMRGSVLLPDYLERLQNGHRDIPIVLLPLLNEIRAVRGIAGINESVLLAFAPDSASASEAELDHARGSLSGRNRELLDTVGNAVKEELLRVKDALDLHLRTDGQPAQLQQQVDELGAVADTLAMMGLDVARRVVVQQRDALRGVVERGQQIDEGMLLDVAGALLYVDASLDDQVAHLGAAGSGEDDPAAAETRRTVEVLAHEAIANFTVAREHFVAFIETSWDHEQLRDVPRLLGEVGGALRMLDLSVPADYLQGVQHYVSAELIARQRVPSGRQLDTLADAMASLEYYLEALRDRRPGREDILEITRSSLETLRYWPLPVGADGVRPETDMPGDALAATQVQREALPVPAFAAAVEQPFEPVTLASAPAYVPPATSDVVFDVAAMDEPPAQVADTAAATPALVFSASRPAPTELPAWQSSEADTFRGIPDAVVQLVEFNGFDPVSAEVFPDSTAWSVAPLDAGSVEFAPSVDMSHDRLAEEPTSEAGESTVIEANGFDPVLAEVDGEFDGSDAIGFHVDGSELSNADSVLSLDAEEADAASPVDRDAAVQDHGVATDGIEDSAVSDEDARFLAELASAAAAFQPHAALQESGTAQAAMASPQADAPAHLDGGFDEQAENIDQDIRDVFLEEFEEELQNLGNLLPAWRAQPDNMDRLRPIRRVFHTLKGSGRLVGARTLGEFAWKIEGMLNRVLDGSRVASPAVVTLVEQAYEALPELNAALRDGSPISADLQGLQGIADRVGAGEETFHIPAPVQPAAEAEPASEADAGTPANIDSVLREILEAEVHAHMITLHDWLREARVQPQRIGDPLLRAVHTMNGAFAMTDVPEITAVTGAAESYIKRALAASEVPSQEAVQALADAAHAIEATMVALQAEQPRVPAQQALAERLQALAATLPEARWPVMDDLEELDGLEELDEPADVGGSLEAGDVMPAGALSSDEGIDEAAAADGVADVDVEPEAEPEAEAEPAGEALMEASVDAADAASPTHIADARVDEGGLSLADDVELTGAADLSAYLVSGEDGGDERWQLPAVETVMDTPGVPAPSIDAPSLTETDVQLTGAEDLSLYLDDTARASLPFDQQPVVEEVQLPAADEDVPAREAEWQEALPPVPSFGDAVPLQEALDEGLHVIDGTDANEAFQVLSVHGHEDEAGEADAFAGADGEPGEVEAVAGTDADATVDANVHEPFFEMETPGIAEAAADTAERSDEVAAAAADSLDFRVLDRELVDIFVEEGKDLLDHCDGLINELRGAPDDREVLAGLQRDLHTLKGGARMAGINAVGDLGHGIESLLEAVAVGRTRLDRSDVHLLERGFDRLHQLLLLTGAHRQVPAADDLVAAFDARTHEQADGAGSEPVDATTPGAVAGAAMDATSVDDSASDADTPAAEDVAGIASQPLSEPLPVEGAGDEDGTLRPQQEQVRVRADLLDRLVNHAGEVAIYRSRLEQQLGAFRGAMGELERTNARLRDQLRRLDLETEAQIVARYQREQEQADQTFDPLELDRFSTLQQLSRALNESAADLGGLQGVLDDLSRQYDSLLQQQSRVSSELQDGLMRARMVPFDGLVPRLRRVVRQAGMDTGKQVHLTLEGTHGELDRNVLDRMVAPLEHMLRNSVAHGLESVEQRRAAGKPEEGEISLRLHREGSEIVLEVADDGAGLDREAIRRRAIERGLVQADAVLADEELDSLIFAAGFSTADQLSQLAGRGVGMDVVRNEVRQLGGSVEIHSVRGQGARFTLRLPQTLAVTQAVFVQIGETTFAVPVASVSGIGRISRERFEAGEGSYRYSGEDYTLYDLGSLVGQAAARAEGQAQVPLLLVRAGDLRAAVAIDQVLGNREIVVKPVGLQIASVPGIYGATITGDGRVVVILDVAPLVRRFVANPQRPLPAAAQAQQRQVPVVMVVDDSLTMRKVTGRILERHNFDVTVARDGVEALERLEERVPDLMLLDIEMPRMDGYELATAMRADPRYRGVPIVMITSRSGDKHRQRAFEIGVQRYLGKPYQELDLMRNVYDLLGIARVRE